MRISTSMMYQQGVTGMQQRTADLVRLQEQIAAGHRIVKPSDDPVGATTVLDIKQSQALNDQYRVNGDGAQGQLSLEEAALSTTTSLLQDVRTLAVAAGNPGLNNSDRKALATDIESRYQELLGIANSKDANGQYMFSGYQGTTRPFSEASPGNVTYAGDDGQRKVQISASRSIAVNDSGDTLFRAIKNGNGTFTTAPGSTNAGSAIIDAGTVTDPAQWNAAANARDFTIRFDVTAGATTYDIVDNVNNVSLLTGAAPAAGPHLRTYVAGSTISLQTQTPPDTNPTPFAFGATVAVTGTPAGGDTFTVKPSTNQDLFSTLHNLVDALRTGTSSSAASKATHQHALNSSLQNIDNALDNVLNVRAGVGARMREVDVAQSAGEDLGLQYKKSLSGLEDLDYAQTLSDLNLQQVYLQAAQQSFLKITSLSLFNLL